MTRVLTWLYQQRRGAQRKTLRSTFWRGGRQFICQLFPLGVKLWRKLSIATDEMKWEEICLDLVITLPFEDKYLWLVGQDLVAERSLDCHCTFPHIQTTCRGPPDIYTEHIRKFSQTSRSDLHWTFYPNSHRELCQTPRPNRHNELFHN